MLVKNIHRRIEDSEWEMLKWIALVTLAAALALLFASASAFGNERAIRTVPATLPTGIDRWAKPMPPESSGLPSISGASTELWNVLELHRLGRANEAIHAWSRIELPPATRVWKYIAVADANLALNQIEEATEALNTASEMAPGHPLVHYFSGLLRLEEAATADEWRDAEGGNIRLVSLPRITPNTKSMFKLAAVMELEAAIENASMVDLDRPLVLNEAPDRLAVMPTVEDLLIALKADHFTARAHNVLGGLYLEKGSLEVAESHMDAATLEGFVVTGYGELGRAYEQDERNLDATRAYLKAARAGGTVTGSLRKAFETFGKSFGDMF